MQQLGKENNKMITALSFKTTSIILVIRVSRNLVGIRI